jgi:ribose/xylose/arabinose/galactoside ABC-type transport system permease subunit
LSQPPGDPRHGSELPAGRAGEPPGSGAGSQHGEPSASASPPGEATALDGAPDGPTTADRTPAEAATAGPAGGNAGEKPWWAQGQTARPPGGRQSGQPGGQQGGQPGGQPGGPPPYQPQPAPWGYPPQAPAGPPAGPGWGPPAPTVTPAAGRDRLVVHLVYEGVLALVAVVLVVATAATTPHQNLTSAFGQAGYLGLMATGFAFSLRTGSPNLAVGAVTYFSSSLSAWLITSHGMGKPLAFVVAILLSTLIGLVLGCVVAVLSVPAWAATLGAVAVIQAVVLAFAKGQFVSVPFSGSYSTAMWYGLFLVLSAGGGALWLIPAVRRPLSAVREPGDPARWLGLRAGLGAVAGLTVSSFLAGLAAVPMLMRLRVAETSSTTQVTFVLAAVLFGGVSVYGRRAGVFGTLLAVTILSIVQTLVVSHDGPFWVSSLVLGLAALFGLAVSRGIESVTDLLGRSRPSAPYTPPAMTPGPYGPPPGAR